ncbi:MAG: nitrilase-related carbon-nitrogen hydrolase, partial [bacterium]
MQPSVALDSGKVKIGLVQMSCTDVPADNLARGLALVERAATEGAQIICLPELFGSRYFCQREDHDNFALAEEIPGPTTQALS